MQQSVKVKPVLKWAGGKRSLLSTLKQRVPKGYRNYYEPFVGGGALFFALASEGAFDEERRAVLSDKNMRLVRTYRAIGSDVERVIRRLRRMRNEEAYYYRTRELTRDHQGDVDVAAWLIYLNRTCFNGLYRVNARGEFNVPFGWRALPHICEAANLRAASRVLKRATIIYEDFARALYTASEGDFVYFDPPYLPRMKSDFTSYTEDRFTFGDHVRLRNVAVKLKRAGVHVLISNSDTDAVRRLYEETNDFEIEEVMGSRSVAANSHGRGRVGDLLIS